MMLLDYLASVIQYIAPIGALLIALHYNIINRARYSLFSFLLLVASIIAIFYYNQFSIYKSQLPFLYLFCMFLWSRLLPLHFKEGYDLCFGLTVLLGSLLADVHEWFQMVIGILQIPFMGILYVDNPSQITILVFIAVLFYAITKVSMCKVDLKFFVLVGLGMWGSFMVYVAYPSVDMNRNPYGLDLLKRLIWFIAITSIVLRSKEKK